MVSDTLCMQPNATTRHQLAAVHVLTWLFAHTRARYHHAVPHKPNPFDLVIFEVFGNPRRDLNRSLFRRARHVDDHLPALLIVSIGAAVLQQQPPSGLLIRLACKLSLDFHCRLGLAQHPLWVWPWPRPRLY